MEVSDCVEPVRKAARWLSVFRGGGWAGGVSRVCGGRFGVLASGRRVVGLHPGVCGNGLLGPRDLRRGGGLVLGYLVDDNGCAGDG